MLSSYSGRYQEEGCWVIGQVYYFFEEPPKKTVLNCFPRKRHQCMFPPAVNKLHFSPHPLLTNDFSCLIDSSYSQRCEVLFPCGFDLHFPYSYK